ncbi:MAG: mannosyltransferase family protein [Myxococcaceae bacterium]
MNRTLRVALVAAALCIVAETTTGWLRHPNGQGAAAGEFPHNHLVQGLVQYDSGWYGEIAQRGYWAVPPNTQTPTAFFPLYPMLMRGLVLVGLNHFLAGIVLSLVFGLSALFIFSKWAADRTTRELANDAGLLFALYPFAFYLYGVVYSDGLFLLLAVSAFYALEKRQVGLATLFGILATATRPVAPAMIVGLVVRNFELQRLRKEPLGVRTVLPVLSAIGMLLYMAYLWRTFGDAELFVHAQSAPGWDNTPGLHTWLKVEFFKALRHPMGPMHVVRLLTHAGVALTALLLAWPTKKLLGWGYALYVLAAVGLPALSSHDFQGLGRYVMAAFPIFLTLAALLKERPKLRVPLLATFAVGIVILAASFGDGQYVA